MTIALYNPLSGNGTGRAGAEKLNSIISDSIEFRDIRGVDFKELFEEIAADTKVIICGGDGTINYFVNSYEGEFPYERDIYYYPTGLGNDFITDIGDDGVVLLNPYIEKLPAVCVNGKEYKVLNGVGYGIDGYCCEEGDRLHAASKKKVNYTSIAIKGLLFKFKPLNAVVKVDGREYAFKKVWLAPTMNGRYYGGGMCVAPNQDRLNTERTVSCVVMHDSGKLKTLMVFPSIFKGEHIRKTDVISVFTGHEIEVTFDRPTALQIDGETIKGVTHYSMKSRVLQN